MGLNPRAINIINDWKNTDPPNPFLFPILETCLTPITIKHRCQSFIKRVNHRMNNIGKELGIEQKTGTHAARHSFSTVMIRKGVSTEFIKEGIVQRR